MPRLAVLDALMKACVATPAAIALADLTMILPPPRPTKSSEALACHNGLPLIASAAVEPLNVVAKAGELVVCDHDRLCSSRELRSSYGWIRFVLTASAHGLQLPAVSIARTRNA
jgi:hypothetical protein